MKRIRRELGCGLFLLAGILSVGCSSPNKPNIELRKKNAELASQVETLKHQHEADAASMAAMEKRGATTVPVLANDQVEKLFTATGLSFGRLTGVDPDAPTSRVKVYVVPTDGAGEPIKAAGSFVVDVFDLSAGGQARFGHAEFPIGDAGKNWFGKAMLYAYVLPVPCERLPKPGEVTVHVTFTDGLTGREISGQHVVKVQ